MVEISLKEHLEARLSYIEKATALARESMELRLNGMNEFRDSLKDQASRFVTREEMSLIVDRLENDIKNLQLARATMDGKASQGSVNVAFIISIIGIMLGIISIAIKFL